MADFLIAELEALGATDIKREELGKQTLEGQQLDLPPAVLATYGAAPLICNLWSLPYSG
jgi:Cys-Gly metallodipeptidase DUG1